MTAITFAILTLAWMVVGAIRRATDRILGLPSGDDLQPHQVIALVWVIASLVAAFKGV